MRVSAFQRWPVSQTGQWGLLIAELLWPDWLQNCYCASPPPLAHCTRYTVDNVSSLSAQGHKTTWTSWRTLWWAQACCLCTKKKKKKQSTQTWITVLPSVDVTHQGSVFVGRRCVLFCGFLHVFLLWRVPSRCLFWSYRNFIPNLWNESVFLIDWANWDVFLLLIKLSVCCFRKSFSVTHCVCNRWL